MPPEMTAAKWLIFAGLMLVLVGLAILAGSKIGLGRLPGDIVVKSDNFTFYFPLATCLLLSAIGTALLWLASKMWK